ncbi:MAG: hypothetical protein HPY66_1304 [Firmicutes bacterium]|nr:hypothetical protein [Bacillota bacterium]MDI6705813.1 hypothetical protein [Bacillota bacterium]
MSKSFVRELVVTNYILIGSFAAIIIAGNLFYGGSAEAWGKSLGLLAVLALALIFKVRRIKAKGQKLDERLQLITYRAVTVGFYFMLGAILWFYTRELVLEGQVSLRTVVELLAGMVGYIGGFLVLNKRY